MDDNDQLRAIFPTHKVTMVFHNAELHMERKAMEYMQRALELALEMDMTPLASLYEALPPMSTTAEGVEDAVALWKE